MPEQLKGSVLRQHGHVEAAGLGDHVVGQVLLVDADEDPHGLIRQLHHGVDDTAVVLLPVSGRQQEQAVA